MKKLMITVMAILMAQGLAAVDITSYSSVNHLWYEDGFSRLEAEETAVIALFTHIHPLLRLRVTTDPEETRSLLQAGLVWIAAGGFYGEAVWGASVNLPGTLVQDAYTSVTREGARSIASLRLSMRYNQASGILSLVPDASLRFQVSDFWATKGQYFHGWDSGDTFTHTVLLEQIFGLGERLELGVISSGIMDSSDVTVDGPVRYGWALGLRTQGLLGDLAGKPARLGYLVQVHKLPSGIFALENALTLKLSF